MENIQNSRKQNPKAHDSTIIVESNYTGEKNIKEVLIEYILEQKSITKQAT